MTSKPARMWSAVALLALLLTSGCAQYRARKHLEGVAKGWCETIRASQVIPVYPLTEDLIPGDVFMVQTTIESQASLYRKRGFLSLDDHRTRLRELQYTNIYFDGYWKDTFGKAPHDPITRTNAGPIDGANKPGLTGAPAPRAAFPTYSFAAKSGFGLALAIPVHGVPVGLNFLRSDRVSGSVTISDARTYAADEQELYEKLRAWTEQDSVRPILSETVEKAGSRPIFLRVISRVYLTGGVIVSLTRAETAGAGLKAGSAPAVSLVDAQGNVNANYDNVLKALDAQANPVLAMKDAGGAVKFVGASESSVALAESFDRLLVIGYLGFDVPVYAGGVIGAPIPTFQRLTGQLADPPRASVGPLTLEQRRFQATQDLLESLATNDVGQAMNVIGSVLEQLHVVEFKKAREAFAVARKAKGTADEAGKMKALLTAYKLAASRYVTPSGTRGPRYARYDEALVTAYYLKDEPH
jgi:hypothetical protein